MHPTMGRKQLNDLEDCYSNNLAKEPGDRALDLKLWGGAVMIILVKCPIIQLFFTQLNTSVKKI